MGKNSKIEWTHHTFNPWRGCTKIATGCAHCYADKQAKRNPGVLGIWGDDGTRVLASEEMWRQPVVWNAEAQAAGERRRVFCASMADWAEDWDGFVTMNVSGSPVYIDRATWRACGHPLNRATLHDVRSRLFRLIDATPWLDWLMLTKRPENILRFWSDSGAEFSFRQNVWLGTSVAVQDDVDRNVKQLLKARDLVPVLFISAEPLVGPINLCPSIANALNRSWPPSDDGFVTSDDGPIHACDLLSWLDWIIVGGESGPQARAMHANWARWLRDQCLESKTPFFFKQWGEYIHDSQIGDGWHPTVSKRFHFADDSESLLVGKENAGRKLDGVEWSQFPRVIFASDKV